MRYGTRVSRTDVHRIERHVTEALATVIGRFTLHRFDLVEGPAAFAVTRGDLRGDGPLLARVHSSCITAEVFGGCDCDCREQLAAALERISAAGRGIVFYLQQEGRGAGFGAKVRDRMLVQASGNRLTTFDAYDQLGIPHDQRTYETVAAMRAQLGVRAPLQLLTGNATKAEAVRRDGSPVAGHTPLRVPVSAYSAHHLRAKRGAGEAVEQHAGAVALPPERVMVTEPTVLDEAPDVTHVGGYWLPIRAPHPAWFRLDAYVDERTSATLVMLRHGRSAGTPTRILWDRVRDRFPVQDRATRPAIRPTMRPSWGAAASRIVRDGGGRALFLPEGRPFDDAAAAILAHEID